MPSSELWCACLLFFLFTFTARVDSLENDSLDAKSNTRTLTSLCDGKPAALGMETGVITNAQITASSSYNLQSVGPHNARLNRDDNGGAWCPLSQLSAKTSGTEWIEVDLKDFHVITAISTQGRFGNGMGAEFVEEYWLEYSRDNGLTWKRFRERHNAGDDERILGNSDTYTPHRVNLSQPLVGVNRIRIVPYAAYQRMSCLRFELYGCRHQHHQPIVYAMPDGVRDSSFGDLRDLSYDGDIATYGWLRNGLGQLTDGIKGNDNYKVNYGFEWVGWKDNATDLTIIFQFQQIVNFTSVSIHAHNLFSKNVQVFSTAKLWFSFDGIQWSKSPIDMKYMPDLSIENARDVIIHLQNRIGLFVRLSLSFSSQWMLISEIQFNGELVDDNTTLTFELLEAPFDTSMSLSTTTTTTSMDSEAILVTPTTLMIICISVFLLLAILVIIFVHFQSKRKQSHGHIVVSMKDLATTPLYCEPKDFSSTSSTISNNIADAEYAVPDVAMTLGKGPRQMNDANGHLTNNLNIFGNDMSRIFMVGSLKDQMRADPGSDVSSNVISSDSTSNMVYHLKKAQNMNSPKVRNYTVNRMQHQQHYASTDLMAPSITLNTGDHNKPKSLMTSNTIYTNKQDLKKSEDSRAKLCPSGMAEDMKCMPEIMENDIEILDKQFGLWCGGQVFFGRFGHHPPTGSSCAENNESFESLVIIKTLEDDRMRNEFLHEMKSKWFISAKSDRVAKLVGYTLIGDTLSMMIEHGNCDLNQFLTNCDKNIIGLSALLYIGKEVASGMRYLESLGYVHRAITSRNCIIYVQSLQVKITDVASLIAANVNDFCEAGVPLRWTAPEALINATYSTKSDVFSYGVTLWEILNYCLLRPHYELSNEALTHKICALYEDFLNDVSSNYHQPNYETVGAHQHKPSSKASHRLTLPQPSICPLEIYGLLLECWHLNEMDRPTFKDITQFLPFRKTFTTVGQHV